MTINRTVSKILLSGLLIVLLIGCSPTASSIDAAGPTPVGEANQPADTAVSTEWGQEELPDPTQKAQTTQIAIPIPTLTESGGEMNSQPTLPASSGVQNLVDLALNDLAQRLSIEVNQITVLEVREVVWPDASLGCPQPDMLYKQVPYDGLLIRLSAEGEEYAYHSGGGRDPFLCEQDLTLSKTPGASEGLIPPPGDVNK